jgi:hypothetical protein
MPLDRGKRANFSDVDEELGCTPESTLACHLGLFE